MNILKADRQDLNTILALQYTAYQSEAELLHNFDIPPLKQTLSDVEREFDAGTVLKAVDETGAIIGSVRAYEKGGTVYIGKLIVYPAHQRKGIGTALLREIESVCPAERYELFTSVMSLNNLRLYEKAGYARFREQEIASGVRLVFLEKTTGNMKTARP